MKTNPSRQRQRRMLPLALMFFSCCIVAPGGCTDVSSPETDADGSALRRGKDLDASLPREPKREQTEIRLAQTNGDITSAHFVLEGLPPEILRALSQPGSDSSHLADSFAVYVGTEAMEGRPAMLGSYQADNEGLHFHPRYGLESGVDYFIVFDPAQWVALLPESTKQAQATLHRMTAKFKIPRPPIKATTRLTQIYPSGDLLPENLLKFYFHFSAPMSRGRTYERIALLAEDGSELELPFLSLGEELWDFEGRRFTLFFDPGRIKRELKPRLNVGTPLKAGRRYTLVIDSAWQDAQGNPLVESVRKSFSVGPHDIDLPAPSQWTFVTPKAGSLMPLDVQLGEPLDQALLERLLWIRDTAGDIVAGSVKVSDGEKHWTFTPQRPWPVGDYFLVVDTHLEDRAGNSVGRPFEVDESKPRRPQETPPHVELPFTVPADEAPHKTKRLP